MREADADLNHLERSLTEDERSVIRRHAPNAD
jgi:hypothetical protein